MQLNWYLLIFIGLILSIISCFYYLRLIKLIIFNNSNSWVFLKRVPKINSYIISFSVLFNLFFILFLPIFYEYLNSIL
jgi:NADH:ubiquinone oxidoreductase subunit 2 (subunit N)